MKTFYIFQQSSSFKFDLRSIHKPTKYRLVLISKDIKLSEKEKDIFDKIYWIHNFNLDVLKNTLISEIENAISPQFIVHEEITMTLVARLREVLNINGPKLAQVLKFTDKTSMKKSLECSDIRLPKYKIWNAKKYHNDPELYVKQIVQEIGLPSFVKKTNSTCSDGVSKINTTNELKAWALVD